MGGPCSCVINRGKPGQWRHSDCLASRLCTFAVMQVVLYIGLLEWCYIATHTACENWRASEIWDVDTDHKRWTGGGRKQMRERRSGGRPVVVHGLVMVYDAIFFISIRLMRHAVDRCMPSSSSSMSFAFFTRGGSCSHYMQLVGWLWIGALCTAWENTKYYINAVGPEH